MFIAVLVLAGDVDAGLNSALVFSSVHPELLWGTARVSWDWETQSENRPLGFSFPSTCNQIFRSLRNWQGKSRLLEDLSEEQTNLLGYTCFYFHMDTEVQVITSESNNCHIHENKSENACVQIDIELKKQSAHAEKIINSLNDSIMMVPKHPKWKLILSSCELFKHSSRSRLSLRNLQAKQTRLVKKAVESSFYS